MDHQIPSYCQHFEYLKISQGLHIDSEAACKYCFQGPNNLWMCLSKGCSTYVCAKANLQHLFSHLEQSRRMKKFHSIFINVGTAEIKCVQCNIQIGDLDIPSNQKAKKKQDPFIYRTKILPGLTDLVTHKILGQLQNSEGHRKISRGLVGLFSGKYNYSINTAIQFIVHSKFIREFVLHIKVSEKNRLLGALQEVMEQIQKAQFRAVHSDAVSDQLYKEFPYLYGYRRKDPFDIILHFFNAINEDTLFYSLPPIQPNSEDIDEWDMFYKKNALMANYIIYNAIESTLSLNYHCSKCNRTTSLPHNIQFLKLTIPKKKRRTKQIQKQLASHRYESPLKNRRKSLMNLFKEEECPLTLPELIIQLMKSPLHKEMNCDVCSQTLKKTKIHFQKLPDILIIQIARISKDGSSIDTTPVELTTESLDMGSFTANPDQEIYYDFESAVCIEKGCLYATLVVGQHNRQKYIIRNQIVELCKEKLNPYLFCYRKRPSASSKQKTVEIRDDLKSDREKLYVLPDFWYLQLENGIQRPFKNHFVCRHNSLKPNTQSKMINPVKVSSLVYEDLKHFYQNFKTSQIALQKRKSSKQNQISPQRISQNTSRMQQRSYLYNNEVCQLCSQQVELLNVRRKKQREYVLIYDKLKGQSLPFCMISANWIKRWSNFLYNKDKFAYMCKGHPLPLSIDNKMLLDVKNQDYKILNIYLWKFLKQLYGGGPQIRYKWKQGRQNLDEQMVFQIKSRAMDLKYIFCSGYIESPKKMMTSISFNDKSSFIEEGNQSMIKPLPIEELLQQQT